MLVTLFTSPTEPAHEPHSCSNRHHSICTTEGEDAYLRKKERTHLEAVRSASLIDKETCQIRARDIGCRASSSRPKDGRGSPLGVPNLQCAPLMVSLLLILRVLGNQTRLLVDCQCYAPQVCFTCHSIFIFIHSGQLHAILLGWVNGK